jgi:hypothetical protein
VQVAEQAEPGQVGARPDARRQRGLAGRGVEVAADAAIEMVGTRTWFSGRLGSAATLARARDIVAAVPRDPADSPAAGLGLCQAPGDAAGGTMAIRMRVVKLQIMTSAAWYMIARSSPAPTVPSGGR